MVASRSILRISSRPPSQVPSEAAQAYNSAGIDYQKYAEGPATDDFSFDARSAFADRRIWEIIDTRLKAFAKSGRQKLTVLDAGCGPGTWLRRVVARASELGIHQINARGFDISIEQIAIARARGSHLRSKLGLKCQFDHGDITHNLPYETDSIDLCLCLNGVLNHVNIAHHMVVARELARVTAGALIVNVRSTGSTPSIFVDDIEKAGAFTQDNDVDRLAIDLKDGRHIEFDLHLFRARELTALFEGPLVIANLIGLDLFHSRFRPDPRWNPVEGADCKEFYDDLAALERAHCANPDFIDHATHILIVAEPECLVED
jgi:SAM-dependent methyltransferase